MSEVVDTTGIEHIGNPDFLREVEMMVRTHKAKAAGYAGQENPDQWANFREAEAWGITPLEGCLVRMGDKYRRIQNLRRNPDNDRVGESIKDTLRDLANYAIIAVCLILEEDEAAVKAHNEATFPELQATIEPGNDSHGANVATGATNG